jgi:hypothetical protein
VLSPSDPQQNNGYSYAHNDPVSMSDPTGLDPNIASSCNTLACRNGMYTGSSGKAPAAAGNRRSSSVKSAGGVTPSWARQATTIPIGFPGIGVSCCGVFGQWIRLISYAAVAGFW